MVGARNTISGNHPLRLYIIVAVTRLDCQVRLREISWRSWRNNCSAARVALDIVGARTNPTSWWKEGVGAEGSDASRKWRGIIVKI